MVRYRGVCPWLGLGAVCPVGAWAAATDGPTAEDGPARYTATGLRFSGGGTTMTGTVASGPLGRLRAGG